MSGTSAKKDGDGGVRQMRKRVPRSAHAQWKARDGRTDPIALIEEQNASRLPWLVPVRWGRMLESPFSFMRGAARVMAHDLAETPVTGLKVQACGDAHLANFGIFASAERNLLFDLNDFDETFRGPWEWDLKRLATSAVLASRAAGVDEDGAREAASAAARTYREMMRSYAEMNVLDVWYSKVDARSVSRFIEAQPKTNGAWSATISKAERRTSASALLRLTTRTDGGHTVIEDHPPLVTHEGMGDRAELLRSIMSSYRDSLTNDRRELLDRFEPVDFAFKVVGVGSVGTRCFVALLSSEGDDPLFLQIKEAQRSVLDEVLLGLAAPGVGGVESPCGRRAAYDGSQGRRVVEGQRLMQAASDPFLGWSSTDGTDYYVRQLWDMKGSVDLSSMRRPDLVAYSELCGWALARAHARSKDARSIAAYTGSGEQLEIALCEFALRYADQTEKDHAELAKAVKTGRVSAETGV
jgi:uncharacterized protein (DUF2252 family)